MKNVAKKTWQQPQMEVLNVNLTLAGPGLDTPDYVQPDPTEVIHFTS